MTIEGNVKFGDICREVKLYTKDPVADGFERYIGLEHLDSESLKIKRWGIIAEDNPSFTRIFKKGQILFGKRRPYLRKAAIAEFDGICSGDIIVLEPASSKIVPGMLPHIISSDEFWSWAIQKSSGSLSPRTKFKDLSLFTIKLESLTRQKERLRLINSIFSVKNQSDELKTSVSKLKKSLENLFRPSLFKETHQDKIPRGWEIKKLGEIVDFIPGYAFKSKDFIDSGVPLIRIGNLYNNKLDMKRNPAFLPEEYINFYSKYAINRGDILLSMTGTAGKEDYGFVVISHLDTALLNQRVCKIIPKLIEKEFLFYYLKSRPLLDQLYSLPGGTKQANISTSQLASLDVIVPPYDYQKKVSDIYYAIDAIEKSVAEKESEIDRIYRSSL